MLFVAIGRRPRSASRPSAFVCGRPVRGAVSADDDAIIRVPPEHHQQLRFVPAHGEEAPLRSRIQREGAPATADAVIMRHVAVSADRGNAILPDWAESPGAGLQRDFDAGFPT